MGSESIDDYLKAILALTEGGGNTTTGELARYLGLTPASATGMVQKLARQDPVLVKYSKSRGVRLAEAGRHRALEVLRHHRLIEAFLYKALNVPWDKVHAEAERLEHYISEDLEARIAEFLGHPSEDPHGAPIPSEDGTVPEMRRLSAADLEPGKSGKIVSIPTRDLELQKYLLSLGLEPGIQVTLESVEPFGGPVYLRVNGRRVGISPEVAAELLVLRVRKSEEG